MDWKSIIRKIAPTANLAIVSGLAAAMPEVIHIANLTTPQRLAMFLAQTAHESAGFKTTVEYASGSAYNGRTDLGNTQPGDGPRFKGRGLIQLTGRSNYTTYGRKLGIDLVSDPSLAAQFPYAALTAAYFWRDHNLNYYADNDDVKGATRKINGGYNGLADRIQYYKRALSAVDSVKPVQQRLKALNYPLGSVDGDIGPLTRSALRDFQDAAGLPVTGAIDQETFNLLMSKDAPERPVPDERKNLTAKDLRDRGSDIAKGTFAAQIGAAGAGLASAANVAGQVSEISSNVQSVSDGVKSGMSLLDVLKDYWPFILLIITSAIAVYFAYIAYKGAKEAEKSRLDSARNGVNVRI